MNTTTDIYTSFLTTAKDSNVTKKTFSDVVQAIKTGQHSASIAEIRNEPDKDKRNVLKLDLLPQFFPTLVLGSANILDDDSRPTGIVQFDVDLKDNLTLDFNAFRQQLILLPATFYVFSSPSGGLKFGIRTDFCRHSGESTDSLRSRYLQAYALTKDYVTSTIVSSDSVKYDDSVKPLKYACYLSSDPEIFFNADCDAFRVDDRCLYSVPTAFSTKAYDALTEEQIIELLSFIPRNLGNDARLPINLAVMSVLGNSAISLLESHWTTSDKVKLKSDLNYQLKKINDGGFIGKVGLLIEMAKENGYVTPRATRLANRINFDFEKVSHTFPELYNDNNIAKSLDIAIESGASQLLRISTGGGKSEKVAEVISGKKRKDTYLLLCDTNENIDKHVERINKYYSKRVTNPLKIPDTPITLEDLRYKKINPSHKFSRAVPIKGKLAMCNKINRLIDFDLEFQKKYSSYIPNDICQSCILKEEGDCNYYNQGGLITFKKLKISDVVDENFVDTAANLLWGDDYNNRGNQTRYFGNTRGYDEMQDCDYMVLIGDYNLPSHALQDQFWNLYGEPVDLASHAVEHLNRMRGGSCIKTKKKQFLDPRLQSIYEHSCTAELEQALGRGRLIYGKSKTILVYSSIPLGGNVEITKFIDPNDIFPRQVVEPEILDLIKEIGFIQKKSADIINATGLTKNQWNNSKEDIFKNFIDAGFVEEAFTYMKSKKYKTETYLVFDQVKFDSFKLSINA